MVNNDQKRAKVDDMNEKRSLDGQELRMRIPLTIQEISERTGLARGTIRKAFDGGNVRGYVIAKLVQLAEQLGALNE